MKIKIVIFSILLTCVLPSVYANDFKMPGKNEIFTISIQNPSANIFTPNELIDTLSKYRVGSYEETGLKVGDDRVWQNGVIVLKNKKVLFWSTDRKRFISIQSDTGKRIYLIRDDIAK